MPWNPFGGSNSRFDDRAHRELWLPTGRGIGRREFTFPRHSTQNTPDPFPITGWSWYTSEEPDDGPGYWAFRDGCYYMRITQAGANSSPAIGTFRMLRRLGPPYASGDLYLNRRFPTGSDRAPDDRVPIFPRRDYRCHVKVLQLVDKLRSTGELLVAFLVYWESNGRLFLDESSGPYKARLRKAAAPLRYPFPEDYYEGPISRGLPETIGMLKLGLVSRWIRRARLEIDTVGPAEPPRPVGVDGEYNWKSLLAEVGWKLKVKQDAIADPLPQNAIWSNAELHDHMTDVARGPVSLDQRWHYHLLCVPYMEKVRGYMYDWPEGDLNGVPREGAAIESDDTYQGLQYGTLQGTRFVDVPEAYMRTAIHEIGHAFGLDHNAEDSNYIMTKTSDIAGFDWPANINWDWHPIDKLRLAHWPDPWVRPGGTPWEHYEPDDGEGAPVSALALRVGCSVERFPLGAPVRLNLALENTSDEVLVVPASLGISHGAIHVRVRDPERRLRTAEFMMVERENPLTELGPGRTLLGGLSLLWDKEGPLFPTPGRYEIEIEVGWVPHRGRVFTTARCDVFIMLPATEQAEWLAYRALSEPQLQLQLVLAGDEFEAGRELLGALLEDPHLGPHYAFLQARRLAHRFFDREADARAASDCLGSDAVLNESEQEKARKWAADRDAPQDPDETRASA